jgi:ribosomal protein S18 acetylase RimI-like enzyme
VTRLEIRPFADEHVDDAARLLADRHARHRAAEPLLPGDVDFRAEVEALWTKEGSNGAVALRDGRAAGYVLGSRLSDATWGPNAWIELAGHAVDESEDVRDLYAFAAARWVEEGRTRHYVYVPATDAALVDAWFRIGFGVQHALGIRELGDDPPVEVPGVVVREVEERDVEALVKLAPELTRHQNASPVFAALTFTETSEELRAEIYEEMGNPEVANLVAEVDGKVVANFVLVPIEMAGAHVGLGRPAGLAHLGFAVTDPEARGAGAGLALTAAGFEWARAKGYPAMVTDWRVTNLLSSRFWPKRGFRISFLRLYRSIP